MTESDQLGADQPSHDWLLAEFEFLREGMRQDQRERLAFLGFALAASSTVLGLLRACRASRGCGASIRLHQSRQSTSKCPIGSSKPFTVMGPASENRMPLPRQRSCTPAETTMQSG